MIYQIGKYKINDWEFANGIYFRKIIKTNTDTSIWYSETSTIVIQNPFYKEKEKIYAWKVYNPFMINEYQIFYGSEAKIFPTLTLAKKHVDNFLERLQKLIYFL
jgi:hypothetical protein